MDVDGDDDEAAEDSDASLPDVVEADRLKAQRHEAFKRKLLGPSGAAIVRRGSATDDGGADEDDDADDSPPPTSKAKGKGKFKASAKGGKGKEKEVKYTPLEQQVIALKEKYVRGRSASQRLTMRSPAWCS